MIEKKIDNLGISPSTTILSELMKHFAAFEAVKLSRFLSLLHLSGPYISEPEAGFDRLVPAANNNSGVNLKHNASNN